MCSHSAVCVHRCPSFLGWQHFSVRLCARSSVGVVVKTVVIRCPLPFGLSNVQDCRLRRPNRPCSSLYSRCRNVSSARFGPCLSVRLVWSRVMVCRRYWGQNWGHPTPVKNLMHKLGTTSGCRPIAGRVITSSIWMGCAHLCGRALSQPGVYLKYTEDGHQ